MIIKTLTSGNIEAFAASSLQYHSQILTYRTPFVSKKFLFQTDLSLYVVYDLYRIVNDMKNHSNAIARNLTG